ncbi:unnamed protein product [Orchesella dallaii]|uniref:FAD-dependent oxidoreductase domain-containing protein 1 n=1 Tax=Orchesella dallaii TaxID=48710 RepID=A0ABP1RZE1_9HEXA
MTRLFKLRNLVSDIVLRRPHACHVERRLQSPSFVNHGPRWIRNISTTSKCFKKEDDDDFVEVPRPKRPIDEPFERAVKIFTHDIRSIYDKTQPPLLDFSAHVDILVIGGGILGSAIAYFIKERTPRTGVSLMVVDKDQSFSKSATAMSVGGLRHHFTLKENVEMARYGAEFLRTVPQKLACDGSPPPDIQYHPYGFLQLADVDQAQELQESFLIQKELGCHVELLTSERLKDKFPWINTDGVELACLGMESEGWFDAWALHFGLKRKSVFHGAEYVQAEVVGFDFEESTTVVAGADAFDRHEKAQRAILKTPSGEMKTVDFAYCIIAAGHESGNIAEMARMGRREGMMSVPLPVEPRRRHVYCIHAPNGPGIDCPFVADTSGIYFRREGYAGHFVTGKAGPVSDDPKVVANLEVDYNYFNDTIMPALAHRVPGFNNVKLNSAWTGLYDYNTFDQSGIIGPHNHQPHMYFACGFSGHGIQQAPAVARATMELLLDGEFRTLDLSRIHFERFLVGKEIKETIVN